MATAGAQRCVCSEMRSTARRLCRSHDKVVLAVSGGSDSMCMLHAVASPTHALCRESCGSHADPFPAAPLVVTIDHGLRQESAAENHMVLQYARELGVAGHAAALQLPEGPGNKVMETARVGRYAALARAAVAAGAGAVLVAHHAGDQAETHRHRQQFGSGPLGLAGMRAETAMSHLAGDHTADLQGITVVRPFLQFEKRHMQDYCTANAVPWVEDPTNSNPAYMRTRHRIELAAQPSAASRQLASDIEDCQQHRDAVEHEAATGAAQCVVPAQPVVYWILKRLPEGATPVATPCGGLRVEPSVLQRLSADAAHLLIAAALQAVHLRHWAAPSKDVRRVLITAASQQPAKYTVHKCIIERRADGHLHISPQP